MIENVLFPPLLRPAAQEAVRFESASMTYEQLAGAAAAVAAQLQGLERVALYATPTLETAVGVLGGLLGGLTVVPINPKSGDRELQHIVSDSAPEALLASPSVELPVALAVGKRIDVDPAHTALPRAAPEPDPEQPALILYTSGTTGLPKGAVLPRRAIATNLDALADVWEWTADDVLVHGLPLFHAHGLVLGTLGPLRRGGRLVHLGRFSPEAAANELAADGTMLFGVPTMYARLATAAEQDRLLAHALGEARLLVSGSAALPAREHRRIEDATGQRIVERYGLTETLMNCSVSARGDRRPGYVGSPLPGVDVRLLDERGQILAAADDEAIGEVHVRGPNLFTGYLNRPDATASSLRDGWFRTGDLAACAPDGYIRIVGRKETDLIKTGGYKVGAGEVEGSLLEHALVAEAAVAGEPDDDLGERIVAWIVPGDGPWPSEEELANHVASLLAPHKRPRAVRFVDELPRNAMGKVVKSQLGSSR